MTQSERKAGERERHPPRYNHTRCPVFPSDTPVLPFLNIRSNKTTPQMPAFFSLLPAPKSLLENEEHEDCLSFAAKKVLVTLLEKRVPHKQSPLEKQKRWLSFECNSSPLLQRNTPLQVPFASPRILLAESISPVKDSLFLYKNAPARKRQNASLF